MKNLPPHVRLLSTFGERAAWSPDGKRLAFMHKMFGDALEFDLATMQLRCLTCGFPHPGFFRVQYLMNGDYFLIGPAEVRDLEKARWEEAEMWVLRSDLSAPPVRLHQRILEGVAISRQALRIAWAVGARQYPDRLEKGVTELWVAEIGYEKDGPRLVNPRRVHQDKASHCSLEAQDFRQNDRELIFACYQPQDKAEVMGIDLVSSRVANYSNSPDVYDEPEGIFPDGESTLVECDRQNGLGHLHIDLWKLRLDGTGKEYSRLTFFTDYPGYKASNPVVSPDGKRMAFQAARTEDVPGLGRGILLLEFEDAGR